ncbi:hypothetical protein EGR52_12230 [bacterium]|nr:hypothetical protein [bacterium]
MKNNKKIKTTLIVLIIILILVLCFNVGVYAAYALAATDVSYTKPNGTQTSVKVALDEVYAKVPKHSIGDEVTYKGEPFFVIADKGTTYELLAKYVLNSAATKQENEDTDCEFSASNYWSGETLPTSSPYLNLNTYLAVKNDNGSAVYKANNYAKSLGAIGGRLLTYEETNNLKDSYSDIIYVTYGESKYYWLGSAYQTNNVWCMIGDTFDYNSCESDYSCGVRPVIEIYKSAI